MALVRGGLAALVVAVTLAVLPAGSAMAGTNIDTVAGGGTNPIDEIQAKNTTFGAAGVAG
ncbi:MAG: hypothetical protein QOG52_1951, partial [Frankiaceae bacterium]|nr:hypothetical protein [Frankiaceae bacterium]